MSDRVATDDNAGRWALQDQTCFTAIWRQEAVDRGSLTDSEAYSDFIDAWSNYVQAEADRRGGRAIKVGRDSNELFRRFWEEQLASWRTPSNSTSTRAAASGSGKIPQATHYQTSGVPVSGDVGGGSARSGARSSRNASMNQIQGTGGDIGRPSSSSTAAINRHIQEQYGVTPYMQQLIRGQLKAASSNSLPRSQIPPQALSGTSSTQSQHGNEYGAERPSQDPSHLHGHDRQFPTQQPPMLAPPIGYSSETIAPSRPHAGSNVPPGYQLGAYDFNLGAHPQSGNAQTPRPERGQLRSLKNSPPTPDHAETRQRAHTGPNHDHQSSLSITANQITTYPRADDAPHSQSTAANQAIMYSVPYGRLPDKEVYQHWKSSGQWAFTQTWLLDESDVPQGAIDGLRARRAQKSSSTQGLAQPATMNHNDNAASTPGPNQTILDRIFAEDGSIEEAPPSQAMQASGSVQLLGSRGVRGHERTVEPVSRGGETIDPSAGASGGPEKDDEGKQGNEEKGKSNGTHSGKKGYEEQSGRKEGDKQDGDSKKGGESGDSEKAGGEIGDSKRGGDKKDDGEKVGKSMRK